MLIILSPSKTMDMSGATYSEEIFSEKTEALIKKIKTFSENELSKTMKIKGKILESTLSSYADFDCAPAKAAIDAYTGFVFKGLELKGYSEDERRFLEDHFIILSALYGCLLPADRIKEYRLDMTMKIYPEENLYSYWKEKINSSLVKVMEAKKETLLINLASNEFSKLIDRKTFPYEIIDIDFKEEKDGKYKSVATYAKKARGLMSNYIVRNQLSDREEIKNFSIDDYSYNKELSTENKYIFTR